MLGVSVIAIEIAHAYVSITPSLRGAQKQIESQLAGVDVTAAGSHIGEQLSRGLGRSLDFASVGQRLQDIGGRISDIGGSLTKYITAPALVAAGAIAGITANLGWGRLVALDSAQAQLRGLGYAAEDVERISSQVTTAVRGGMTTMAEGTSVAAGALAAGVKEGAELERYIRLVGDAAVGANRPVVEMSQIFNRVEGAGKLMTQELNMIEQGLPGFAAAMSSSMGVSQDEFRAMVTAGEVSSQDFLTVMDSFAGGMASAYADSWSGMVANTKAWVGIIGENILRGVFQDAKLELADFQAWLQTDEVQQWAQDAGAAIGRAFSSIISSIRDVIDWWSGLSGSTKQIIGTIAGIAVVAGPVLIVIGKLVTGIGGFISAIPTIAKVLKPVIAIAVKFGAAFLTPIGLVVAAVAALTAGLVWFFTQTEVGQRIIQVAWAAIQTAVRAVVDWFQTHVVPVIQAVWAAITDAASAAAAWFGEHVAPLFQAAGELIIALWEAVQQQAAILWENVRPVFELLGEAWSHLWEQVQAIWDVIGPPLIEIISTAFTVLWEVIQLIWNQIRTVIETVLGVIRGVIQTITALIKGDWSGAWEAIKGIGETIWNGIKGIVENAIMAVSNIISGVLDTIKSLWSTAWDTIKSTLSTAWDGIKTGVSDGINAVMDFIRSIPERAIAALGNIGNVLINAGRQLIQGFLDGITGAFGAVRDKLGELTNLLPSWKGPASRDKNILKGAGQLVIGGFVDGLESQFGTVRNTLGDLTDMIGGYESPSLAADGLMDEIDAFLREVTSPVAVAGVASGRGLVGGPVDPAAESSLAALAQLTDRIEAAVRSGSESGTRAGFGGAANAAVRGNRLAGV